MKQALPLLLLLAACSPKKTAEQPAGEPFRDIAVESGLVFEHVTGATGEFYLPEIMGSGCALFDYDGDGDLDVLLIQGSPQGGSQRLFRNDLNAGGKIRFTDVTKQSGLERTAYGMGVATGDFNNDGYIDLLVTAFGANALYRNNGDGTFRDVTAESPGIALKDRWSTSAAFFDYDRDGWQDLIILNYVDYSLAANKRCYAPTGELDYCTPRVYRPLAAHLFHNDHGRFTEVSSKAGITSAVGPGLGVVPFDANGDGWLDLFVANDSMANHLWINQRNGTFAESALQMGTAYGEEGLAKAGMGVAAGDYDNDGDEDLLVLNLMREGATLFRNDGVKGFTDVSQVSGIHAHTLPWTGFGAGWADFDCDGWLDLFIANGAVTRREEQRGKPYPFAERNLLLRNPGGGNRFEAYGGSTFGRAAVSRAAAFGDIDNDGGIDILVNVNHGRAMLLHNGMPRRNWSAVDAPVLGTRVDLKAEGLPAQVRFIRSSGSYLAASDPRAYFGIGNARRIEWIRVTPPGSSSKVVANPTINSIIRVH